MTDAKRKPVFIKINEIKPGRHCYNIYGKITKVETKTIKDRK